MTELTESDKALLRELQRDMPLCARPFAEIASRAGLAEEAEEEAIARVREWLASGIIRRLGAFIRHREAGFTANGMAVWDVPEERIEEIGRRLAEREDISHCYARPRSGRWPYRLYTMIHGKSEEEVKNIAAEIAGKEKIKNYKILFSTRELKKSDTRLFMEDGG